MSKSTHRRQIRRAIESLQELDRRLDRLHDAWDEQAPGLKAQAYDGAGGSAGGHADPTGDAVANATVASRDQSEFGRNVEKVERILRSATAVADKWLVVAPAKAEELAKLEREAEPGCEIVARIKRKGGQAFWEPVLHTSTVGGLLPREYRLGSWAYKFVRKNGRLPTEQETRTHCDGRTVYVKAS